MLNCKPSINKIFLHRSKLSGVRKCRTVVQRAVLNIQGNPVSVVEELYAKISRGTSLRPEVNIEQHGSGFKTTLTCPLIVTSTGSFQGEFWGVGQSKKLSKKNAYKAAVEKMGENNILFGQAIPSVTPDVLQQLQQTGSQLSDEELRYKVMSNTVPIQPRDYQVDLFESAKDSNSIICLDPGSGKTKIASLIMRYKMSQWGRKKIIAFVCPTQALAYQQVEEIRKEQFQFNITTVTGETLPFWSLIDPEEASSRIGQWWSALLDSHDILVMTDGIIMDYFDCMSSQLGLVVFDECHHAIEHYRQNAPPFQPYAKALDMIQRKGLDVQVLGLTATPAVDHTNVFNSIHNLQYVTGSKIITVPRKLTDFYSAHAEEKELLYSEYDPFTEDNLFSHVISSKVERALDKLYVSHILYETILAMKEFDESFRNSPQAADFITQDKKKLTCKDRQRQLRQVFVQLQQTGLVGSLILLYNVLQQDDNIPAYIYKMSHQPARLQKKEQELQLLEVILLDIQNEPSSDFAHIIMNRFEKLKYKQYLLDEIPTEHILYPEACTTTSFQETVQAYGQLVDSATGQNTEPFPDLWQQGQRWPQVKEKMREYVVELCDRMGIDVVSIHQRQTGDYDRNLDLSLYKKNWMVTPKLRALVDCLRTEIDSMSDEQLKDWRCMIFVDAQGTAITLERILRSLPEFERISCDYITGAGQGVLTKEAMDHAKYLEILQGMSDGKINLLISTNVSSEGIDFPACCLVISWDLPGNLASYVQTKGRARAKNSVFLPMIEEFNFDQQKGIDNIRDGVLQMRQFIDMVSTNQQFLLSYQFDDAEERSFVWEEYDQQELKQLKDSFSRSQSQGIRIVNSFIEKNGVEIDITRAMLRLNQYFQNLPDDYFKKLVPQFFYKEDAVFIDEKEQYKIFKYRLIMPVNCPVVPRQIESDMWYRSKRVAKAEVALMALEKIDQAGELDELYYPKFRNQPEEIIESQEYLETKTLAPKQFPTCFQYNYDEQVKKLNCYLVKGKEGDERYGWWLLSPSPLNFVGESNLAQLSIKKAVKLSLKKQEVQELLQYQAVISDVVHFKADKIFEKDGFSQIDWNDIKNRQSAVQQDDKNKLASYFYFALPCENYDGKLDPKTILPSARKCQKAFHQFKGQNLHENDVYEGVSRGQAVYTIHTRVPHQFLEKHPELTLNSDFPKQDEAEKFPRKVKTYLDYFLWKYPDCSYSLDPNQQLLTCSLDIDTQDETMEELESQGKIVHLPPQLLRCHPLEPKVFGNVRKHLKNDIFKLEQLLIAQEAQQILQKQAKVPIGLDQVLQSFTTSSAGLPWKNESLEFLGDSFLKYFVSSDLYFAYPNAHENKLSSKRTELVKNKALIQKFDEYLGLREHVRFQSTSSQNWLLPFAENLSDDVIARNSQVEVNEKRFADSFEAIVGSLYLQGGQELAGEYLENLGFVSEERETAIDYSIYEEFTPASLLFAKAQIEKVQNMLGYQFKDLQLFAQAFTHISYARPPCYQRLEFLGDAVLDWVIATTCYEQFENEGPGMLSHIKQAYGENVRLAYMCVQLELDKLLLEYASNLNVEIRKFKEKITNFKSSNEILYDAEYDSLPVCKVLADIVEALIGAVYVDSDQDFEVTSAAVLKLLGDPKNDVPRNPVIELEELAAQNNYEIKWASEDDEIDEELADLLRVYTVGIYKEDQTLVVEGIGKGQNTKVAKRQAAKSLLQVYYNVNND